MKKFLALIIVSISLINISCKTSHNSSKSVQYLPIQGTWLVVMENDNAVTNKIHIKNYTDTHFSWEIADNEKNIRWAGSGTYEINKNVVTETLNYTSEGNHYRGTTATLEMKLRNDTLFSKGKMNADGLTWTETHVRLK